MTNAAGGSNVTLSTGTPEAVRVELLGRFRVSVGDRTVGEEEWRLRKAGSLIKLLALAQGHRLHRERTMHLLWPELDPESAANNLHRALHFARRALDPTPETATSRCLEFREELLALCPDEQLWVDVEAFEDAAATARRSREVAAYRAAIDLYSGELLPGDLYEPWVENRRRKLRTVYFALLFELAGLHEEREEPAPAIEALQKVLTNDRAHEEAHSGLIRLYAETGRRREALLQYRRLQKALSEVPGAEPDAGSRRLYEDILAGRFPENRGAARVLRACRRGGLGAPPARSTTCRTRRAASSVASGSSRRSSGRWP